MSQGGQSRYVPKPVPPVDPKTRRELTAIQAMPYGLKGFRRFCKLLKLPTGKPFVLRDFQAFMLGLHFDGVIELVILIPKKNGKTTLLAAVALYHLLVIDAAYVAIGASAKDQATYIFDQADGFVTKSGLAGIFDVKGGYRLIRLREAPGRRIRVLAGEVDTGDGVIPTLALVDELHRHRNGDLYEAFRNGLEGDQDGWIMISSTAAAALDTPLGRLRELARPLPMEQVKLRRTYRAPDNGFALIEYALADDDDTDDISLVKQANPAPWHTIKKLRMRHATNSPGTWLRFACGIWTSGEEPEILPKDWDVLKADEPWHLQPDEPAILAPSVGGNAAIALAAMRPDGKVVIHADHLEHKAQTSIMARTEELIVELCDQFHVVRVLDPGYGLQRTMELLKGRGIPVSEDLTAYSSPRQIAATGTFDRFMRTQMLIHSGDEVTRTQVLKAIKKSGVYGEHDIAGDETRAILALSMAVHHAAEVPEEPRKPRIHSYRGA